MELLADGKPHSAYEISRVIAERLYGGAERIEHGLRIGARIWDLKKRGHNIDGKHDPDNPQKYWYQLIVKPQGELFHEVEVASVDQA